MISDSKSMNGGWMGFYGLILYYLENEQQKRLEINKVLINKLKNIYIYSSPEPKSW